MIPWQSRGAGIAKDMLEAGVWTPANAGGGTGLGAWNMDDAAVVVQETDCWTLIGSVATVFKAGAWKEGEAGDGTLGRVAKPLLLECSGMTIDPER